MDANPTNSNNDIASSIEAASVIFFAPPPSAQVHAKKFDQQIWNSVRALGSCRWRSQVLIVDPNRIDQYTASSRTTYRPNPRVFVDLNSALNAAKHESIVVCGQDIELTEANWKWRVANRSEQAIQSFYQSPAQVKGYKKLLLTFYSLFLKLFLKTGFSKFTLGFLVIPKNKLAECESPDSSRNPIPQELEITALISQAKLNGIEVEETEFKNQSHWPTDPTNSKSVLRSFRNAMRYWWNNIMFPSQFSEAKGQEKKVRWKSRFAAALLMAVLAGIMLFSNLDYPLFEPDEARNAQLAINVLESGEWLSLTLTDKSYWDKPPLQIWMIATSYKCFGISPFATRFPGVLASLLTVMVTFFLGRRLIGERAAGLAALTMSACCGFIVIGRYVTMDAGLTLAATTMTLSLFIAANERLKRKWLAIAGLAAGLGLLIKGPVILVIGLPPFLLACSLRGNSRMLKAKNWLAFVVPMILIAAPWYLATAVVHPEFMTYFFWHHHVVRFSDAFNHREPFWYYAPMMLVLLFPASILLPALIRSLTSRAKAVRVIRTKEQGFLFLNVVWVLGFFSFSESKLPTYVLPAIPFVCLLLGVLLQQGLTALATSEVSIQHPRWKWFPPTKFSLQPVQLFSIALAGFLLLVVGKLAFHSTQPIFMLATIGILLIGLAAIASRKRFKKPKLAWQCVAVLAIGFVAIGVNFLVPQIARSRSIHRAAHYLQTQSEYSNATVIFFGRENHAASMTLPSDRVLYFPEEEADSVCQQLQKNPASIIISSKRPMKNLRRMLSWNIRLEKSTAGRHIYVSSLDRLNIEASHVPTIATETGDTLNR